MKRIAIVMVTLALTVTDCGGDEQSSTTQATGATADTGD